MAWLKLGALAAAMVLTGAMLVHAEETAAPAAKPEGDKPAKVEGDKAAKKVRLAKPYSEIESLTDEQKQQINDIRKKIAIEIKALQAKEEAEVAAILTEEQKTELAKIKEENAAKMKKKDAPEATTKPAM